MTEQEFRIYIEGIIKTREFIKLNKFLRITEYKNMVTDLFENAKQYLGYHHPRTDVKERFIPDYDYFYNFFESYRQGKNMAIATDEKGYIDLGKALFLKQPFKFASKFGVFTDSNIIMTDGTIHILKIPLDLSPRTKVTNPDCRFCPIIASAIAKEIGVESAEYKIAKKQDNEIRILSKNFLKPEEELVTFVTDRQVENQNQRSRPYISVIFEELEKELRLRRYTPEVIEKIKMDFLKQEFLAKMIGLRDQKADNCGFVISVDEKWKRNIKIAPMFDFDFSFHIAQGFNALSVRQCDNGGIDIGSLIEQYKDYPGFLEFANQAIRSLDMKNVFTHIYRDLGLTEFKNPDSSILAYADFVNRNKQIAMETLSRLSQYERED